MIIIIYIHITSIESTENILSFDDSAVHLFDAKIRHLVAYKNLFRSLPTRWLKVFKIYMCVTCVYCPIA